jgi:hypothetical protein
VAFTTPSFRRFQGVIPISVRGSKITTKTCRRRDAREYDEGEKAGRVDEAVLRLGGSVDHLIGVGNDLTQVGVRHRGGWYLPAAPPETIETACVACIFVHDPFRRIGSSFAVEFGSPRLALSTVMPIT